MGQISVKEAKQLQANWMSTRAVWIEKELGSTDANNVTFSLSDLEAFVNKVRDISEKEGIENPGMRVYFAANDERSDDKATVFLSATIGPDSTDDDNYSIDPFNRGNGGWPPRIY